MNIIQFLRIFWARRYIIVAATVSCLIGGIIVVLVVPPTWKASSRVLVDMGKPDLVTGQDANPNATRGMIGTEVAMITDYTVAGRVVDDLGLMSDEGLIAAFNHKSKNDTRDFRHWLEQLVIDNTKAKLVQDSAIVEISYTSNNPQQAKDIADAVRTAFIQTTLDMKRTAAIKNADWLQSRATQAKSDLDKAIASETAYERANGLVMAGDKQDMDSARLAAMSGAGPQPIIPPPAVMSSSAAAMQLATVEAAIAAQSKQLGPNNPGIIQLQAEKKNLEATVAKENAGQKLLSGIAAQNSAVVERGIASQKAKVVAESGKIGVLNQLQTEVDLRREIFNKSSALAAQQREEALTVESGLTPLASASVPKTPAFPNKMLIFPGALAMGLALGVLASLIMELLARRVRGPEDLAGSVNVPLLGTIAAPPHAPGRRALIGRRTLALSGRRKAATA